MSPRVRRRDVFALLGGAAATWPMAARAQQPDRMRRIGVLVGYPEDDPESKARLAGLRDGLERLGWSEHRNIRIDLRYSPANPVRAQALAKELISLAPDVLLGQSAVVVEALQRETKDIPIVFVGIPDPISMGFADSMARPGGNITGLMQAEGSVGGKWLSMLKEIAPHTGRVAILGNPDVGTYDYFKRAVESLAPLVGFELVSMPIKDAADVERSIAAFAGHDAALVVPPDTTSQMQRDLILSLAARHRLPSVHHARYWVAAGGLMSYGTDRVAEHRQAAGYLDRILRGERPADLPIQAPVKYETILNLKTAKALGLTVPTGLLIAADEVIE